MIKQPEIGKAQPQLVPLISPYELKSHILHTLRSSLHMRSSFIGVRIHFKDLWNMVWSSKFKITKSYFTNHLNENDLQWKTILGAKMTSKCVECD